MTENAIEILQEKLNIVESTIDTAQKKFEEGIIQDLSPIQESITDIFAGFKEAPKGDVTVLEPQLKSIIEKLNKFIEKYQAGSGNSTKLSQANKAYSSTS